MAGIAVMRPGNTNDDVADAIVAKVAEHGLDEHLFSLFIGHGIGIGANEPPVHRRDAARGHGRTSSSRTWSSPSSRWSGCPDVQGGGGVRIEDMILVTDGDPRVLSRVEYEERLLL